MEKMSKVKEIEFPVTRFNFRRTDKEIKLGKLLKNQRFNLNSFGRYLKPQFKGKKTIINLSDDYLNT